MTKPILILGAGLGGVGKTTYLKALALNIVRSVYIDKDDVNKELGEEFDANSDFYENVIAPLTYKIVMARAKAALAEGRTVILDGYFGDKLTTLPDTREQFTQSQYPVKVVYFHCSAKKQCERIEKRNSPRDDDKRGAKYTPYRKDHLERHIRELAQVPHLVIDTENNEAMAENLAAIHQYISSEQKVNRCLITQTYTITNADNILAGTKEFTELLKQHRVIIEGKKAKRGEDPAPKLVKPSKSKKVVILDAGGVLHPDAELNTLNQEKLMTLTGLTRAELHLAKEEYRETNLGKKSLDQVLTSIIAKIKLEKKPSLDELRAAYKLGVQLYPGAAEMIRDLNRSGMHVVLLTNNSDVGVQHTRQLLASEGLSSVKVYGSAEMKMHKPEYNAFLHVCREERVTPEECWFVDDRAKNIEAAELLGMSGVYVHRPELTSDEETAIASPRYPLTASQEVQCQQLRFRLQKAAVEAVNGCKQKLTELGVVKSSQFAFPKEYDFGKYPSLFGVRKGKVVRYQPGSAVPESGPGDEHFVVLDQPNQDGNQKQRCLYQSRLAKVLVEQGRPYWQPVYNHINRLFLADLNLKLARKSEFEEYFTKLSSVLSNDSVRLLAKKPPYTDNELKDAINQLFTGRIQLDQVSEFYYHIWLYGHGSQPLKQFMFLADQLKADPSIQRSCHVTPDDTAKNILLLQRHPNLSHDMNEWERAYFDAQPHLQCGLPQLRGRQKRASAPNPSNANTIGICRDEDALAQADLNTSEHYAAKVFFAPAENHTVSQQLRASGGAIIGGISGTVRRNVFMLAPLIQAGLISRPQLDSYIMGFLAHVMYHGHHSYEEVAIAVDATVQSLDPGLDAVRDPVNYYQQLLTEEFRQSECYQAFLIQHAYYFEQPVTKLRLAN